ncbi:unnamed protein product [Caenorhabditis angaria]|uniref:Protein-cysteine N-palmitoyltransferase porcupine n=1 Tax=Caenorhabditis angaria TaxID=860376 RepID=A0A9P1N7Y4_9PELO|nr:unnamed protein product [Caenorhabditis angaria]
MGDSDEDVIYGYDEEEYGLDVNFNAAECAIGVLQQTSNNLIYLFGAAFLCLFLRKIPLVFRANAYMIISHFLIYQFSSEFWGIFRFFNMVTFSGIVMVGLKIRGNIILFTQIAIIMIFQLLLGTEYMLGVRGILMLHAMRVIAVGYELENSNGEPCTFSILEYLYFPPVLVMGPFLTHQQFVSFQYGQVGGFKQIVKNISLATVLLCGSLTALLISSCYLNMLKAPNVWVEDFIVALSFRTSNYFVCYLSQSVMQFLGTEIVVTEFGEIEWPRSMATIVSYWNIPMHMFLHTYIFSKNVFSTVCCNAFYTFVISSLLHGYDPQISITLLTLGFITFSEARFRRKLAKRFSMCVKAKECYEDCQHTNNGLISSLINFTFRILSLYHLIFTGMPFVDEYASTGYPWEHTYESYENHNFASLYISLALLLFSFLL